jgi:hypothetical protein
VTGSALLTPGCNTRLIALLVIGSILLFGQLSHTLLKYKAAAVHLGMKITALMVQWARIASNSDPQKTRIAENVKLLKNRGIRMAPIPYLGVCQTLKHRATPRAPAINP